MGLRRLPVRGLDPSDGIPLQRPQINAAGTKVVWADDTGGGGSALDWIVVTDPAYGATGDGTTDDTTAIQAALDAVPAGGGAVYFPAGVYKTTGGMTISNPTHLMGAGAGNTDPGSTPSTVIRSSSATNVCFTVNAQGSKWTDLCIQGTATTPTAGSGILISTGGYESYTRLYISGFYTNIDQADGGSWTMTDCTIHSPRKYGMRIRNATSADWGDQSMQGCIFSTLTTADAAIRYESGGGLKISNTKINSGSSGHFSYGIDLAWNSGVSVNFLVSNCSIENVTTCGIRIVDTVGFEGVNLSNIEFGFWYGVSGRAIDITGVNDIVIGNITVPSGGSGAVIGLTSCDRVTIGPVVYENFTSVVSQTSCTAVNDLNAAGAPTLALDDLTDVSTAGEADGDFLGRVSGTWVPVTAPAGGGAGELLMQDGVTSPPVPIETEAGNDWLYEG